MTMLEKFHQLAAAVGNDIREVLASAGDLTALTTAQKDSLIEAINELKAFADGYLNGVIDDQSVSPNSTYSSQKIIQVTEAAIQLIKLGAPESFDTLKEIADWISGDQTRTAEIIDGIENSVRFDVTTSLAVGQIKNVHETINVGDDLSIVLDEYVNARDVNLFTNWHIYPLARTGLSKSFLLKNDQIIMQNEYRDVDSYGGSARQQEANGISVSKDNDIIVSSQRYWTLYRFDGRITTVASKQQDGSWIKQVNDTIKTPKHNRFSRVHSGILYTTSATVPAQLLALKFNPLTNNFNTVGSITIDGNSSSRWSINENADGSLLAVYEQASGKVKIYRVTKTDTVIFELIKTDQFTATSASETHRPPKFSYTGRLLFGYPGTNSLNNENRKLPILVNRYNALNKDFSDSFVTKFDVGVPLTKDFVHLFSKEDVFVVQTSSGIRFYRITISEDTLSYQLIHTLTGVTKTLVGMTPDDRYMLVWDTNQITTDTIMEVWMRSNKDSYDYQKIGQVDVGLTTSFSNGGVGYFDIVAVK